MKCIDTRRDMFAFLDGEVSVERNLVLLQHVNLCPPCARRFEAEKRFEEGIDRALSAAPPPAGLRGRLAAALDGADAEAAAGGGTVPLRAARRFRFPWGRWGFVAMAASFLLAAFLAADRLCLGPFQCPVVIAATQAAAGLEEGRGAGDRADAADAPDLAAAGWRKVSCCSTVPAPRLGMAAAAAEYASGADRVALVTLRIGDHDPKSWNRVVDAGGRAWYAATVGDRRVLGWKDGGVFRALVTASPGLDLAALARLIRVR